MLLAEIRGHARSEVRDVEDYLTSTIFGHLRYIEPQMFWEDFLASARGLPTENGEQTLAQAAAAVGCRISDYSRVRAVFWPKHPTLGTPDLLLSFSGPAQRPFILIIEAKLWAGKSGVGEKDQLGRYLDVLDDLCKIEPGLNSGELTDPFSAVLYLTRGESLADLLETVRSRGRSTETRLYRAQWQDILVAASKASTRGDGNESTILGDVVLFLRHRDLEYFGGFCRCPGLNTRSHGSFYRQDVRFSGFLRNPLPKLDMNVGLFYRPAGIFDGFARCKKLKVFPVFPVRSWV